MIEETHLLQVMTIHNSVPRTNVILLRKDFNESLEKIVQSHLGSEEGVRKVVRRLETLHPLQLETGREPRSHSPYINHVCVCGFVYERRRILVVRVGGIFVFLFLIGRGWDKKLVGRRNVATMPTGRRGTSLSLSIL